MKIKVFDILIFEGVTLLNSATFYGPLNEIGFGANLRLLRSSIEGLDRSKIQLMVKICMDTRCPVEKTGTSWNLRVKPEEVMADVDYALEQLGTDYIDIIVLCRVPKDVAIEEVVQSMKTVVESGKCVLRLLIGVGDVVLPCRKMTPCCVSSLLIGKARHIGLSEASARTIRRAHAVHPIHCIEQEWSLWARDVEADIVPTCRELGKK